MARLTSELMVRLIDGVTKPAGKAARALRSLSDEASRPSRATNIGGALAAGADAAVARLDKVRGALFDAVAVGYMLKASLTAPIDAAQRFETMLEDIGQKADIPTEGLGKLGSQLKAVAAQTNQSVMDIGASFDALVGMGAKADVALAASGPIGQAATAYRAASEDLARASFSAVDNLKVPAEDIGLAIDAMAQAGKLGAFELRDMAQYFPQLGAGYQALGQEGVSAVADLAAALQIVRKGTGDSSSAATNLANVLQKVYSNRTITGFKKLGVNIREEMKKAAEAGKTPIEAIAEITNKTLKGDLSKLGLLFEDAQVQAGLRPLIQNIDEYRRIRDEAMNSEGTVADDFARRMETSAMMTKRWQNTIDNLNLALGSALIPALTRVVDALVPVINSIREFSEAHPELVGNMALAVAGLAAFKIGLTALQFGGLWAASGALRGLSYAFLAVGKASESARGAIALQSSLAAMSGADYTGIQKLSTALGAIVRVTPGLNLVGPALGLIGSALGAISLPVVAGIAAVAGAGLLIWKYWDRLSSIFSGVASAIGEKLAPAFAIVQPALDTMKPVVEALGTAWKVVADAAGAAGSFFASIFSQEKLTDADKAAMAQAGADAANAVMNAIGGAFTGLGQLVANAITSVDYAALGAQIVADLWAGVQGAFAAFGAWVQGQIASFFKLPEIKLPDWLGGKPSAPAANSNLPKVGGAFAEGGDVKGRVPVIVGDGGEPELFTPKTAGTITPFSKLKPMRGGAAAAGGRGAVTYAPQFVNNAPIYGVADLEGLWQKWEAKMHQDFKALMAGTFSDPGATA
jgi:TP901 family phage tail tape measure protein